MDPIQMPDIKFQSLQRPPNLDESLMQKLDGAISSQNWIDHHQFITVIRSIHKYYPQYIPNIMGKYGNGIYYMLSIGKTQLIKNIYKLLQEVFNCGKQINVAGIVEIFLPYLLKKASTDLGHMKQLAQEVVSSFSQNCGYDVSFLITSTHLSDKNNHIAELAVKLLAKLIQNTGNGIMKLNFETLKTLMHELHSTIQGKRANMKNWGLDICIYIFNQIGQENYLSLMNHTLTTEQIQNMGKCMQLHRVSKNKPVPLANALKQRKSMMNQQPQQENYQGQFGQQYNGYN